MSVTFRECGVSRQGLTLSTSLVASASEVLQLKVWTTMLGWGVCFDVGTAVLRKPRASDHVQLTKPLPVIVQAPESQYECVLMNN